MQAKAEVSAPAPARCRASWTASPRCSAPVPDIFPNCCLLGALTAEAVCPTPGPALAPAPDHCRPAVPAACSRRAPPRRRPCRSPRPDRKAFAETVCTEIDLRATEHGLPQSFIARLIWKESLFDPGAVSPKGAQGIAQFMPGTAKRRGLDDPFDAKKALAASAAYLADLRTTFGNLGLAAAAYNAGEDRVRKWLAGTGSLPYETQDYVYSVTGHGHDEWKADNGQLRHPCHRQGGQLHRPVQEPRHARAFTRGRRGEAGQLEALGRAHQRQLLAGPGDAGLPRHPQPLRHHLPTKTRWWCASSTAPWAGARWCG